MANPVLIGLAGQSCAGKNAAAAILEKHGFFCIDSDAVSKTVFSEHEHELFALFKDEAAARHIDITNRNAALSSIIDRQNFALLVFSDEVLLKRHEDFILPKITAQIEAEIRQNAALNPSQPIVLNAPTLHKTELVKKCSFFLYIKACTIVRIVRALKRDRIPLKQVLARFSKQNDFFSQYFFPNADIVVVKNSGSIGKLENRLLQELKKRGF